eukprot:CFRG2212T1
MASLRAAFPKTIRELRLHLCQTGESSKGLREFIEKEYVSIKKANPKFPILIRECSGVEPKVFARYGFGVENSAALSGKSSAEVASTIESLVKHSA